MRRNAPHPSRLDGSVGRSSRCNGRAASRTARAGDGEAAADERAATRKGRRERLPGSVRPAASAARDPAARMRVGESGQRHDGAGLGDHVGLAVSTYSPSVRRDSEVHVRREAERPWVLEDANALRHRVDRPGHVRDDDGLVDLGHEGGDELSSSPAARGATTAEPFTPRAPPGRPQGSSGRRPPVKTRARSSPARRAARAP